MTHFLARLPLVRAGATAAMIVLAGLPAAAQDEAAQDDAVVATVDGTPITEADLALAITDLDQQFAQLPEDQRRAAALSAVIEIRLLSAAAQEAGLAEGEEFERRMELLRQRALHSAYIDEEIASHVTDEAIRARYDEQVAATPPREEVRARHIIVETQEEAQAIIEELDAGGDFEEIAKAKSTDGAAAQGGDLGYFGQGQMVPQFEQAAFAMEVGDYSQEPVQTQFGWHVIKVEDKRTQEPPAFDQVKEQFRSLVLRETYLEQVGALREAAETPAEATPAEEAPAEEAPAE